MTKKDDYVFGEVGSATATFAGHQRAGLIEDTVNLALRTMINPLERPPCLISDGRTVTYTFPAPKKSKGGEFTPLELSAMQKQLLGALKLVMVGQPVTGHINDDMLEIKMDSRRDHVDVRINASLLHAVQTCNVRLNCPEPKNYRN
jgi:hypothetical protein